MIKFFCYVRYLLATFVTYKNVWKDQRPRHVTKTQVSLKDKYILVDNIC